MKIIQTSLHTESAAMSWQHVRQESALDISITAPQVGRQEEESPIGVTVAISDKARAAQTSEATETSSDGKDSLDPRLRLLLTVVEMLTGEKVRLFNPAALQSAAQSETVVSSGQASPAAPDSNDENMEWSIRFSQTTIQEEAEVAQFSAQGHVSTADGRSISFSMNLLMQRYQRTESSVTFEAGNARKTKDPLVLNLSTDQVRLTGNRIDFDLNADGQQDQIANLAAGSGYLVLDRNANGSVDNGTELFGPISGNGYSELALLDEDKNGWIDENDTAYAKLQVWRPSEQLISLKQAGVGAISLSNSATPFSLMHEGNFGGAVRNTGVFLTEDGQARTIQQIDLAT